jgi:hypothetical protein
MGLDDILNFGKYKNWTIQEVIDENPDYLAWAIDNIEWFNLDKTSNSRLEAALSYYDHDYEDYSWHEAYDLLD